MLVALVLASVHSLFGSPVTLHKGQAISRSVMVAKRTYRVGTISVSGKNIVVDFNGATLQGVGPGLEPDQRLGTGVKVTGENVTIKNLHVRGYKLGLVAINTQGLKLENCDFSYNYKQRLGSTPDHEAESDWMSYHDNEKGEWKRYGAGAYLENCENFLVSRCRATGGQCGLMLVKSNHGAVLGCNFSYLSGIGLGMYRSSHNLVQQNNIDYCVRGYSYGVYYRGQDSAGILVYEQSSHNLFAYNSVTHGGDGFFLWAGQSTMDTGEGGCNDNLVYGNDFSHAVTNAIEATFSRNVFRNNLAVQSWHGVWGGYSYDSVIEGNTFIGDLSGVAIEHGQNNKIKGNMFLHDRADLEIYADPITDASWGYPNHRDTASHGYEIDGNFFKPDSAGANLVVRNTKDIKWGDNVGVASVKIAPDQPVPGLSILTGEDSLPKPKWGPGNEFETPLSEYAAFERWSPFQSATARQKDKDAVPVLAEYPMPFLPPDARRGRRTILVDQWGPYDYRYPKLVMTKKEGRVRHFDLLGPKGGFIILSEGIPYSPAPAQFTAKFGGTIKNYFIMNALYSDGPQLTDYKGNVVPAKALVTLPYIDFIDNFAWKVKFFVWDKTNDPRTQPKAFDALLAGTPQASADVRELAYGGRHTWAEGVPADYFALSAETPFEATRLAPHYYLEVVADDGVRLFLDGKPLQLLDDDDEPANAFKYQGATTYHALLKADGKVHHIRVEYFQIDGGKTLSVRVFPWL